MPHRVTIVLEYHAKPDEDIDLLVFHLTMSYVPRVGDTIAFESSLTKDLTMTVTAVREKFFVRAAPRIEIDAREVTSKAFSRRQVIAALDQHEQAELGRGERRTGRPPSRST
jgi:hypothetical protein